MADPIEGVAPVPTPKQRRWDLWKQGLKLAAVVVIVAGAVSLVIISFTANSQQKLISKNNDAALCRAQNAADDSANQSHSQNVTLELIKALILRNFDADAVVKAIDEQVAKNNASADSRQSSVDTCQAVAK